MAVQPDPFAGDDALPGRVLIVLIGVAASHRPALRASPPAKGLSGGQRRFEMIIRRVPGFCGTGPRRAQRLDRDHLSINRYSRLSARAWRLASTMLSCTPTVPHSSWPS